MLRAVDDVLVRDDVAGAVVDEAGALGLLVLLAAELGGAAALVDGDLDDAAREALW